MTLDDRTAWYNLMLTGGLGPVKIQHLATALDDQRCGPAVLDGLDGETISKRFGVRESLAYAIAERLRDPVSLPPDLDGSRLLVLDDEDFPNERYRHASPPMVPALWVALERGLLAFSGRRIGFAGSRDTSDLILERVQTLAAAASRRGWLVVSGLAQGVDSAAHEGGILGGTGTIGVLASGIANASRSWMPSDPDALCLVSQFQPSEPWSGPRAMQRNSTIASLSDCVVIAASGLSGGSWEMGNLCIKHKKRLFVFDLEPSEAEGNQQLIRKGAIAIEPDDVDGCLDQIGIDIDIDTDAENGGQASLFD